MMISPITPRQLNNIKLAQIPVNKVEVWATLLPTMEDVYNFIQIPGQVLVVISEDAVNDPRLSNVPNKVTANILLPPFDSISAELDGNLEVASTLYYQWLDRTPECIDLVYLLAQSIMIGKSIGVYFGPEVYDMRYPSFLLNYLANKVGIVFDGIRGPGLLNADFIPVNLSVFLLKGTMSVPDFLSMMPVGLPIPPQAIQYLITALRPPLYANSTLADYNLYFMDMIKQIHESGKYLYSPIVFPKEAPKTTNYMDNIPDPNPDNIIIP